ncbi:MAG: hypothetical protein R2911_27790 [Caldilineaceae bacterium]
MLILAGFAFGIYFLYMLATHREYRTRRLFWLCGLIGVAAVLLMAPLGWPLIADQFLRNYPEDVFVKEYYQGSDLLGWFIPNVNIWPWAGWCANCRSASSSFLTGSTLSATSR